MKAVISQENKKVIEKLIKLNVYGQKRALIAIKKLALKENGNYDLALEKLGEKANKDHYLKNKDHISKLHLTLVDMIEKGEA